MGLLPTEGNKFILSIRDVDEWCVSIERFFRLHHLGTEVLNTSNLNLSYLDKIHTALYGSVEYNDDFRQRYLNYNAQAIQQLQGTDFAVIDVSRDADKLASFLHVEEALIPHANFKDTVVEKFQSMTHWPEAVGPYYLPQEDAQQNALGKLRNILFKHPTMIQGKIANIVIEDNGFDVLPNIETFDWRKLPDLSEFDGVLLYDVLDHLPTLNDVPRLLGLFSQVPRTYVFCHPRRSRLGTHLFDLNLAYIHLYEEFSYEKHTLDIENPLEFYRHMMSMYHEIKDEFVCREPVEYVFDNSDAIDIQYVEFVLFPKIKLL